MPRKDPKARREYEIEYAARNKDKLAAYIKQWKAEHPNYDNDYYKNNEARRELTYAYYEENKDFILSEAKIRREKVKAKNSIIHTMYDKKKKCLKYNLPFDLDETWAEEKYTGKCSLTGIDFVRKDGKANVFSPSIDRIDNSKKGYTQDNCRLVLLGINMLKFTGTDTDMYKIAEALVANKPKDLS